MLPSEENVTTFLTFAPEAGEGKAFLYLEVSSGPSLDDVDGDGQWVMADK